MVSTLVIRIAVAFGMFNIGASRPSSFLVRRHSGWNGRRMLLDDNALAVRTEDIRSPVDLVLESCHRVDVAFDTHAVA